MAALCRGPWPRRPSVRPTRRTRPFRCASRRRSAARGCRAPSGSSRRSRIRRGWRSGRSSSTSTTRSSARTPKARRTPSSGWTRTLSSRPASASRRGTRSATSRRTRSTSRPSRSSSPPASRASCSKRPSWTRPALRRRPRRRLVPRAGGRRAPDDRPRARRIAAGHLHAARGRQPEHARAHGVRSRGRGPARRLPPAQRSLVVAPFAQSLAAITGPTDDRETIAGAVGAIASRGGTAIADGLIEVSRLAAGARGPARHRPDHGRIRRGQHAKMEDALASAQSAHAAVYVIGVGGVAGISLKGERALRQIASETGGRVFFPSREEDLPAVHELVAEDVQQRYLITYSPTNQTADGAWRKIALSTSDASHRSPHPRRLLRADAASGQAVARIHRDRRRPPVRRPDARRSRRGRERRASERWTRSRRRSRRSRSCSRSMPAAAWSRRPTG